MSDLAQRLSILSPEKRAILQRKLLEKRGAAAPPMAFPSITRRTSTGPCAVSFGQELMWLLDQLTPGISAYNVPRVLRLQGPLDREALKKSLAGVLQRHSILRTSYSVSDGIPMQVVDEHAQVDLREFNLSSLPEEQREAEALRIVIAESDKCFDLKRDLMMRTALIRLDQQEHIFVLVTHHIASDGGSRTLLFRELAAHYEAFTKGVKPKLSELPIQFADFAVWQRGWFKEELLQTQLEYWKKQLAGAPPVLELPADHPRPAVQTFTGARLSTSYPKATAVKLREFGQKEGATQFMLMLAVFKVLLYRYTGQEDIVVGTPVSGRSWTEIENVIGYFSNSLVLRTSLAGNPTFRQLLQRVREMALEAFSHQDLPFEKLVEKLQPERDLSRSPLYQIMFSVGHAREDEAKLPGLTVTPLNADRGTAKFDMTFGMREAGDALYSGSEFSTDLFEPATIKRMFAHLGVLMEGIAANPDQLVGELPLLTEAERQQVLFEWNNTRVDFPGHQSVHQLFEEQVASTPECVAAVFENQALTYRELNARANQVAHRLKSRGVSPEVQVAIFVERSLEMIVGVLGILKAGGAYVAIDASMPKDRMSLIFAAAGSPALLTTRSQLERLPQAHPEIIFIESDDEDLLSQSSENLAAENHPNSLAYVIYTSGSTGVPKGVMVSHANLLNSYFAWEQAYRLRDVASAHLQMANYAFDVFCGDLVRALCSGAKLVLCPLDTLVDPRRLYELMRKEKVDCAEFVPAVLRNLIQHLTETGQSLDFMRLLIAGSDAWYVEEYKTIQGFCGPQTRLINSYGLAEATVDSTYFEGGVAELSGDGLVPIGMPFPNSQCYILDGRRQLLPIGVNGELCIGGAGLARGYLGRPELTAEKFIPNPFATESGERLYCTGDMAKYRACGTIEFLGRSDDQVKIRGFRIELGEIEALLKQHPRVMQAVVLIREDTPGQKRLIAYVVLTEQTGSTLTDLREFLKGKAPHYMIPAAFVCLPALPLSANGKVNRKGLPAPDAATYDQNSEFVAPRTPVEELIAGIWIELLKIEKISIHDSFFDLGGHSLLATQGISRLRDACGVELTLRNCLEAPTVIALAEVVTQTLLDRSDSPSAAFG